MQKQPFIQILANLFLYDNLQQEVHLQKYLEGLDKETFAQLFKALPIDYPTNLFKVFWKVIISKEIFSGIQKEHLFYDKKFTQEQMKIMLHDFKQHKAVVHTNGQES